MNKKDAFEAENSFMGRRMCQDNKGRKKYHNWRREQKKVGN